MKLYRKIDVYRVTRTQHGHIRRDYLCSTNQHRLCREARESARAAFGLGNLELDARFSKDA